MIITILLKFGVLNLTRLFNGFKPPTSSLNNLPCSTVRIGSPCLTRAYPSSPTDLASTKPPLLNLAFRNASSILFLFLSLPVKSLTESIPDTPNNLATSTGCL